MSRSQSQTKFLVSEKRKSAYRKAVSAEIPSAKDAKRGAKSQIARTWQSLLQRAVLYVRLSTGR
jgi:hypothetical protein